MPKSRGFTLIELMIVIMIIAIVASIAIPNLLRSRITANETAALASLKTIATQQAIFKQQTEVDQDDDGIGEHGLLGELSRAFPPRGADIGVRRGGRRDFRVKPIYLSQAFQTTGRLGNGIADKAGYYFRMYLADGPRTADDDSGLGGAPGPHGGTGGQTLNKNVLFDQVAINIQEMSFACYAWPVELYATGRRAFIVNEIGDVYQTRMDRTTYTSIIADIDTYNAGYHSDDNDTHFNDPIASGDDTGMDGNEWNPAGG